MNQYTCSKILNKIGKEKYDLLKKEYSSTNKILLENLNPYYPIKIEIISDILPRLKPWGSQVAPQSYETYKTLPD